jgi:flagellar biosynthetic protein FliP
MPDLTHRRAGPAATSNARRARRLVGALLAIAAGCLLPARVDAATEPPPAPIGESVPAIPDIPGIPPIDLPTPEAPSSPSAPPRPIDTNETDDGGATSATIGLEVPDLSGEPSNAVVIILLLSVLSIAPSLLVLMTSFTRIVIVMSLTRNALGIPQLPPQQVIVGLSLFLTIFVMAPTLSALNEVGLQPLLDGEIELSEALDRSEEPIREFMLDYTREPELELFLDASATETPVTRDDVPLSALIPAFVLSELKSAFILGFIIFVPFLVIDLVVSAVLTSLGMMMLPPTFVSLPLKLLLFILLDGWMLVTGTLLESYR